MKRKKFNLIDFFTDEYRERGFFLVLISFTLGVLLTMILYPAGIFLPYGGVVAGLATVLLLIFSIPTVYILGEAAKRAERKNKVQDLVCECLSNLALIKDGVQPDFEYLLAEGYISDESIVNNAVKLLNGAYREEFMSYSINGQKYGIKLKAPVFGHVPFELRS
jgi:hypothetical protein